LEICYDVAMLEQILRFIKEMIPARLLRLIRPLYHFALAWLATLRYGFPSRRLVVIGVTGTKGKTSTAEILNTILETSGKHTALIGTLRFKIGKESRRNLLKMTMPGRFLLQRLLREAVDAGCTHAIVEMTSEGAVQFRERFIAIDALIFTNLSPEHIESHGSLEKYIDAKLRIGQTLVSSPKRPRIIVANTDDEIGKRFLSLPVDGKIGFSIKDAEPFQCSEKESRFVFRKKTVRAHIPGTFNIMNMLAAGACAEALHVPLSDIVAGLEEVRGIRGRMERVEEGQPFSVIVDYAHTPDSLQAAYEATPYPRICILGNTGGGRDTWKRPIMGEIADKYCDHIILTNEDPYDEDPHAILTEIAKGISNHTPEIILDRTAAMRRAFTLGKDIPNAHVIITGKGTDPYIMGPNGSKLPWDDKEESQKVLRELGYKK
jgi:UDP-N-acetylmuramoyl-L-alanyl-D-glutamate--2,6-diaminopimelate ligase